MSEQFKKPRPSEAATEFLNKKLNIPVGQKIELGKDMLVVQGITEPVVTLTSESTYRDLKDYLVANEVTHINAFSQSPLLKAIYATGSNGEVLPYIEKFYDILEKISSNEKQDRGYKNIVHQAANVILRINTSNHRDLGKAKRLEYLESRAEQTGEYSFSKEEEDAMLLLRAAKTREVLAPVTQNMVADLAVLVKVMTQDIHLS